MQRRHAPSQTLSADALYGEYLPALVDEILACLVPRRLVVTVAVREDAEDQEGAAENGAFAGGADGIASTGSGSADGSAGGGANSGGGGGSNTPAAPVVLFRPGGKRAQRVGGCMCRPGELDTLCVDHNTPAATDVGAGEDFDELEPWFGVRYRREPVEPLRLSTWQGFHESGLRAGRASADGAAAAAAATAAASSSASEDEGVSSAAPSRAERIHSVRLHVAPRARHERRCGSPRPHRRHGRARSGDRRPPLARTAR